MSEMQTYVARVEWSAILEVAILVLCGPVAMVAVMFLPALPGVAVG